MTQKSGLTARKARRGLKGIEHREIQLAAGRRQLAEDSRLRLMASARQRGQKSEDRCQEVKGKKLILPI